LLHWVAKFSPSLWEEEELGPWQEVVREVELEVWKKGKGVFGILLLLQKKNKTKKQSWGLFCFGENGPKLSSTCPPLCFRQLASHSPWEFLFWELLGK
jgi:hypothetical protein